MEKLATTAVVPFFSLLQTTFSSKTLKLSRGPIYGGQVRSHIYFFDKDSGAAENDLF